MVDFITNLNATHFSAEADASHHSSRMGNTLRCGALESAISFSLESAVKADSFTLKPSQQDFK